MLFGRALDVGVRHVMRKAFFPRHAAPAIHVDAMGIGHAEQSLKRPYGTRDALRPWIRKMETRRTGHVSAARESIARRGLFRPQAPLHREFIITGSRMHG